MPIHVAAEMNARHDLLSDVAALGVGDRIELVEVCFLRNRRVVDVDSPFGPTRFDARDFPGIEPRRHRALGDGALPESIELLERYEQIVSLDANVRRSR